jgi:hypothetical protein
MREAGRCCRGAEFSARTGRQSALSDARRYRQISRRKSCRCEGVTAARRSLAGAPGCAAYPSYFTSAPLKRLLTGLRRTPRRHQEPRRERPFRPEHCLGRFAGVFWPRRHQTENHNAIRDRGKMRSAFIDFSRQHAERFGNRYHELPEGYGHGSYLRRVVPKRPPRPRWWRWACRRGAGFLGSTRRRGRAA